MPLAQYRFPTANPPIEVTRRMGAPKIATTKAWYKAARAVIPQVPNLKETDWEIFSEEVTLGWVRFNLQNSVGEKAYLVIDRNVPSIG